MGQGLVGCHPCRVAGIDLGDVAGLPGEGAVPWLQLDVETSVTGAAWIHEASISESPSIVARRFPVRQIGAVAQDAELMLPIAECTLVAVIDFDDIKQRVRALMSQPLIQAVAERAVVLVLAVAERQHRVIQLFECQRAVEHIANESRRGIGCVAFARRADYEQRVLRLT
jgi:hypothetical protein